MGVDQGVDRGTCPSRFGGEGDTISNAGPDSRTGHLGSGPGPEILGGPKSWSKKNQKKMREKKNEKNKEKNNKNK